MARLPFKVALVITHFVGI